MGQLLREYHKLLSTYGRQGWWPAETKFEICVGAILTQNTAWSNVEKAIAKMKAEKLISEKAVAHCPLPKLQTAIRSSGFYRQKAARLREFCRYIVRNYGSVERWFAAVKKVEDLRVELLELKGIGPETADSIILYAAEKPKLVVDSYTHRWAEKKFGWKNLTYAELQRRFETALPNEVEMFKEFHALIVKQGKEENGKRKENA